MALDAATLDDSVAAALQAKLDEAKRLHNEALNDQAREASYKEDLASVSQRLNDINQQIEVLRTQQLAPADSMVAELSFDQLQSRLAEARARAATLRDDAASLQQELQAEILRPQEIPAEISAARKSIENALNVQQPDESAASLVSRIEQVVTSARGLAGKAKLAALEQENTSHESRVALLKVQLELRDAQADQAEAEAEMLASVVSERISQQASEAAQLASALEADLGKSLPETQQLADPGGHCERLCGRDDLAHEGSPCVSGRPWSHGDYRVYVAASICSLPSVSLS